MIFSQLVCKLHLVFELKDLHLSAHLKRQKNATNQAYDYIANHSPAPSFCYKSFPEKNTGITAIRFDFTFA